MLKEYVESEAAKASTKKPVKKARPDEYALLKARATMYPEWIHNKERAIRAVEKEADAANPIERERLMAKATRLKADVEAMRRNQAADRKRMDELEAQAKQRLENSEHQGEGSAA